MDTRPSKQVTFLRMTIELSMQSTCIRRKVGCIITDSHHHIIASGYNGNAAGLVHCINSPCKGAKSKSGEGLELCEATHAEQNALMQCRDINAIVDVHVSCAPCIHCIKMLMNTPAKAIYFYGEYAHMDASKLLWEGIGREWHHINYLSEHLE